MADKIEVNLPDFSAKPRINRADEKIVLFNEIPDEPRPCKVCGKEGTAFDGLSVIKIDLEIERICRQCTLTSD